MDINISTSTNISSAKHWVKTEGRFKAQRCTALPRRFCIHARTRENEKWEKHLNFLLMLCGLLSVLNVFLSTLPFQLSYPVCLVLCFFKLCIILFESFTGIFIWLQPPLSNFTSSLVISTHDWDKLFLIATYLHRITITWRTGRGKYYWKPSS